MDALALFRASVCELIILVMLVNSGLLTRKAWEKLNVAAYLGY